MARRAGRTAGGVPVPNLRKTDRKTDRISDSHNGIANASHGRTDGRTDEANGADVYLDTTLNAGARIQDFTTIGQVIEAGELWQTDQRHNVIRTGEREPIPSHVRSAIWYRDRGKCDNCHPDYPSKTHLELDHITPWSAGGTDTTDNLRLLCQDHNQRRSNFIDFARPKMAATWWCSRCYLLDEHVWTYLPGGFVECPIHGGWGGDKSWCRVARRYYAQAVAGEPQDWHQIPMLTECDLIAYCAHCNLPGVTGVVL